MNNSAVIANKPESNPPPRRPKRILGPALSLRELNLICWGVFFITLILPACIVLLGYVRGGAAAKVPEVDFVYFYGMGRIFDNYPVSQVYDYELQKRVFNELHPLKSGTYNPVPYPPFIGALLGVLARIPFFPAYLVWLLISLILYIAGLTMVAARFFPGDRLRISLVLCLGLSFYPFIGWAWLSGHLSTIGFFAIALALREEDRARPFTSGLALSVCLYKPTLVVLLVPMLFVTKRLKVLAGFMTGCVLLVAFTTALEGVESWRGYINLLLYYGHSSAGVQSHPFKQAWKYIDLSSFAALIPGGRSWTGQALLFAGALSAFAALCRVWWKSAGASRPAKSLAWAATLTWTLVLNAYVPIYDSILIVPSVVATAGILKALSEERAYHGLTVLWPLILACSWVTVKVAHSTGIQVITLLFAAVGILQIAVCARVSTGRALSVKM